MSTSRFNESDHPRRRTGEFTTKTNADPVGVLTPTTAAADSTPSAGEEAFGGKFIRVPEPGTVGIRELTEAEFSTRLEKTGGDLQVGDVMVYRSMSDGAGEQYWATEVIEVNHLIDLNYRKIVEVHTQSYNGRMCETMPRRDPVAVLGGAQ